MMKNEKYTIITFNCAGGVIYHKLYHEFMSPTINLFINNKEFIKFIMNIKEYMRYDLGFIEMEGINYLVAKLNDITIYFDHYKSNEDAKEKWNTRKKRINYHNLFFLCMLDMAYI